VSWSFLDLKWWSVVSNWSSAASFAGPETKSNERMNRVF